MEGANMVQMCPTRMSLFLGNGTETKHQTQGVEQQT